MNLPVLVPKEVYYRYRERTVGDGYTDMTGEYISTGSHVEVTLEKFPVLKRTPKGVWILNPFRDNGVHGDRQFIADAWRKRFALPTREEAFRSFVARKAIYIQHLTRKIAETQRAIALVAEQHSPEVAARVFQEFNYAPPQPARLVVDWAVPS